MKKEDLFELIKLVPQGKVTTYGRLARELGEPRASRMVGRLLHQNKQPIVVPCHRVVFRDGSLTPSFAFGDVQREWLLREGVTFVGENVDMARHCYEFGSMSENN